MSSGTKSEFLYAVNLPMIGAEENGERFDWKANADQCLALAARFGCVEIGHFEVTAMIRPLRKEGYYRVTGKVSARIVQNCVVSLEPVVSNLEQELNLVLLPETETEDAESEFSEEEFETYSDEMIDLGEIGAVELALALDPYPRAPGVSVSDLGPGGVEGGFEISEEEEVARNRPFEALAALKRKS